jgi:type IV secretory pathway VirB10-like protein
VNEVIIGREKAVVDKCNLTLQDRIDNHYGRRICAGLIRTLLGVGAELGVEATEISPVLKVTWSRTLSAMPARKTVFVA